MSLNVEGTKHYERVLSFIQRHTPEVICLQEATEVLLTKLRALGYFTEFMPMCDQPYGTMGVAMAARSEFHGWTNYYHKTGEMIPAYDHAQKAETEWFGYLAGSITANGETYTIITTHFWDSPNGQADTMQQRLIPILLAQLSGEPAHVLCGDFNIPRHHNELYEILTKHYQDNIPPHYQSSLDRNLHRLGDKVIERPIFDEYMVDYVFTQPPYHASGTELHFGVSDHAAITTSLSI